MIRRTLFSCFVLLTLCLAQALGQGANSQFKQLAGPSDEMPAMRLPAPAALGLRSKAAMIPIRNVGANGLWRVEVPVDNAKDIKLMLLAPNSEAWSVNLALPNENLRNLRQDAAGRGITRQLANVALDGDNFPAEVYTFDKAQAGLWTVEIALPNYRPGDETLGYLVVSSQSPYRLYSYVNTDQTTVGPAR